MAAIPAYRIAQQTGTYAQPNSAFHKAPPLIFFKNLATVFNNFIFISTLNMIRIKINI
jgi:hypothetical protein